jgi:hypothetical protein
MSKDDWEAPPEPKKGKPVEWEAPPEPKKKQSAIDEALALGQHRGIDPGTKNAMEALLLSMAKTGSSLGQMVTEPFGSDYYRTAAQNIEQDLRSKREQSPLSTAVGETTGTVLSMPVPGMRVATGAKGFLQAAGLGAALGTASEPVLEGDLASGKAETALKSGLFGAAFQKGAQMLDPALERLKTLVNLGVDVEGLRRNGSLGQLLGGPVETFERFLERVSFSQLGGRRQRGAEALSQAVDRANLESQMGFSTPIINQALSPLGRQVPSALQGYDAIQSAERIISNGYNDAIQKIGVVTLKPNHEAELRAILTDAKQRFGAAEPNLYRQLEQDVTSLVSAFDQKSQLAATTWNKDRENLGSRAFSLRGSDDPYKRDLGSAYRDVQNVWMRMADEADKTGSIRAANAAYSAMQPLYRAAGYVSAARQREGAFTPEQLLTATAAENRRRFQRGTAPFQQQAMAGAENLRQQAQQRQNILGQVSQGMDTGYAGKLIPPVASVGTMVSGNVSPTMAAIGAAPSLFATGYSTTPVQAAMKAMFARQRPGLQQGALRPGAYGAAVMQQNEGALP